MTGPRWAAVLGSPISHSLSPALHRAAYEALGLDWRYEAIDVPAKEFDHVISELRTDPTLVGLSVTMPLKDAALAVADEATDIARTTQAANTLIVSDGRLTADNTDPVGIVWALGRAKVAGAGAEAGNLSTGSTAAGLGTAGIARAGIARAGIVGAGATTRSALAALSDLGVTEVEIVARRPEAMAQLQPIAAAFGIQLSPHDWDDFRAVLSQPVVISTVPAGVCDGLVGGVSEAPGVLLDVVYAPWPTELARRWSDGGGQVVSGLEMLVGQAGRQIELMTGTVPPLDVMLEAALKVQAAREQ